MDKESARAEIFRLRQELSRHNQLYYKDASPEISDMQYDELTLSLQELEEQFPELKSAESPSVQVGSDSDSRFPSQKHSRPMLSLQNSYHLDDVIAFALRMRNDLEIDQVNYTVEPKMDGVALAARYQDGRLTLALTRGNGKQGDVITDNAATFKEIPAQLSGWEDVLAGHGIREFEVRGE